MSKEKNRRKNQKLLDKASLLQSSIDLADHILSEVRRLLPLLLARHQRSIYLAIHVDIAAVSGITTEDSETNHSCHLFLFYSQRGEGITLSMMVTLATISFNMCLGGGL